MKLKNRIQRIQEKVDSDVCPLCGHDTQSDEVRVCAEFERLIAKGWSEEDAHQILNEAAPEWAKRYLPSLVGRRDCSIQGEKDVSEQ